MENKLSAMVEEKYKLEKILSDCKAEKELTQKELCVCKENMEQMQQKIIRFEVQTYCIVHLHLINFNFCL